MRKYALGKLAAIITRNGQCFFDRELSRFGIGWGQKFLLLRVYENEGTSILDLAKKVFLDQSTTTRGLQKLRKQGYIRYESDQKDRRIRCVYTTESALPVIEAAIEAQQRWNEILISNMTSEEADDAHRLMEKMARNAFKTLHGENETDWENCKFEEKSRNA